MELRFTKSARLHKVGRARAIHVLHTTNVVVPVPRHNLADMQMYLGPDHTGRLLEVGVVLEDDQMVVIHVMDLREKFRAAYEAGKGTQQ